MKIDIHRSLIKVFRVGDKYLKLKNTFKGKLVEKYCIIDHENIRNVGTIAKTDEEKNGTTKYLRTMRQLAWSEFV